MDHLPALITDLALILITGAAVTLLFKWIKQPVVLGYIIAGFCVGPHLSLIPTVADTGNIKILAEIGVIFLLFSLGLEFNFKKLLHVGGASSITALVEIVFITVSGYILGRLLRWSVIDSMFLGGMLASSSTTIIIKAFDDMDIKTKKYAGVVFGILIVEDIVVILLMVLLPTIAVAKQFSGLDLTLTILKLLFFLVFIFISGIFLVPTFLRKTDKYLNDETLLILSVGLCLGMVILAKQAGFSAELGAFLMGIILAESASAEKIEKTLKPVKDLFAAVFFVSIGMMIEPSLIIKYGWAVVAITALTITGKLISTIAGALISGQELKQSVQIGMSMAQIGEFAFIVASLGLSLGVISDFLFPVAVGVSAITTFTTPYMIKYSDKFSGLISKILPENWITTLQNYSAGAQSLQTEKAWKKVIKSYTAIVLINSIFAIAIILLSRKFLLPFLNRFLQNSVISTLTGFIISLILIIPFLWGITIKRPDSIAYKELWTKTKYNRGPVLVLEILRLIAGFLIIGLLVDKFFSAGVALLILVPVVFIVLLVFSKEIKKFYNRLERRFLSNLGIDNSTQMKNADGDNKKE